MFLRIGNPSPIKSLLPSLCLFYGCPKNWNIWKFIIFFPLPLSSFNLFLFLCFALFLFFFFFFFFLFLHFLKLFFIYFYFTFPPFHIFLFNLFIKALKFHPSRTREKSKSSFKLFKISS